MADVSGPCSTLPGASFAPEAQMCDDHPNIVAYLKVQGETDSFGAEYHHLCKECYDKQLACMAQARCGQCDWCKKPATDLCKRRDFEEGMCGPVYDVCGSCRRREIEEIEQNYDYDD